MEVPSQQAKVNNDRIKQLPITGAEVTKPPLNEIRDKFREKIGTEISFSLAKFSQWLQGPTMATGATDGDCEQRAGALAPRLCKDGTIHFAGGQNLANNLGATLEEKWKSIDRYLEKSAVVTMKGTAVQFGGEKSNFSSGKHVVIFVGFGKDVGVNGKEEEFYIAFDPDVFATTDCRSLWTTLLQRHETQQEKFPNLSAQKLFAILTGMLFGEDGGPGFGPVFRKYYPNKQERMQNLTNALYKNFNI